MEREEKVKIINGIHYAVMGFILNLENSLLLIKRTDDKKWQPVTGYVREGEDYKTALLREVKEETNLDVKLVRKVGETSTKLSFTQFNMKVMGPTWICRPTHEQEVVLSEEHSDYKWVPLDLVEDSDLSPPIANPIKLMLNKVKNIIKRSD